MTAWMLYGLALAGLVGGAALLLERAAALCRLTRRWIWCVALGGSLLIPVLVRLQGSASGATPGPSPSLADLWQVPGSAIARAGLPSWNTDRLWTTLWIVASVSLLLWLGWCWVRLRRERAGWIHDVVEGTEVLVSEELGPAVIGPFGSTIVIPRWLLNAPAEARRLALAHERSHLDAGDAVLLSLATIAVIAAPWNPVIWWQLSRLRAAVEMDCDRRVLAGGAGVRPYAELLLALGGRPGGWLLRPALVQLETTLGRRIMAMLDRNVRLPVLRATTCAIAALGILGLACQAAAPQDPSEETQTVSASSAASQPAPVESSAQAGPKPEPRSASSTILKKPFNRVILRKSAGDTGSNVVHLSCTTSCVVTSDPPDREPMFIVDGVTQKTRPDLKSLEGNIERVEVVKGAAALALWGEKARNGVVQITTKKR